MSGTVVGLCGTALLMEPSIAQVFPPYFGTNAPIPIPTPNATSTNTPPQAAGIYQAEPYKMLVVVPAAQIDDRMVMSAPAAPHILQHAPEIQLVPRARR